MDPERRKNGVFGVCLRYLPPFILVTGALTYLILIVPLVQAGGHLDGNPYYSARTILFVVPLILSRVLDFANTRRRSQVIIYILGIVAIFGAIPPMNPWWLTIGSWLENLIPAFISVFVVAGITELLTAIALWLIAVPVRQPRNRQKLSVRAPLRRIVFAAIVIGTAIYWPDYSLQSEIAQAKIVGRQRAVDDWAAQCAYINMDFGIRNYQIGNLSLRFYCDPETGLQILSAWPISDIQDPGIGYMDLAYDDEIHQLIKVNGYPAWSMKKYIIAPPALAKLFESAQFKTVEQFPFQIEKGVQWANFDTLRFNGGSYMQAEMDGNSNGPFSVLALPEYDGDFILKTEEDAGTLYSPRGDLLADIWLIHRCP